MSGTRHAHEESWTRVVEVVTDAPPGLRHPGWAEAFPWLVQGTTGPGEGPEAFDLGLFGPSSSAAVAAHWERLRSETGAERAVTARQVHGAAVRWAPAGAPGLLVTQPCDGHATAAEGVLLAVTVADCVPVSVVSEEPRAVAILHAGWRGAAAGVLEAGIGLLEARLGVRASALHLHLGPSICGACYEVGPEVFGALGRDPPRGPAPLDLRAALARRAAARGVAAERTSMSAHCTRCGPGRLFSHRGGDAARQVGYEALRPRGA